MPVLAGHPWTARPAVKPPRLPRNAGRARAPAVGAIASALTLAMACAGLAPVVQASSATPAEPASHRVITLAPHATEIVYAAGGGSQIVGTVSSSDHPDAARDIPRVGDGILLNQERIIVLRPTLLIGWQRSGVAVQTEALAEKLGAQMLYSQPRQLRDIPAEVRRIGALLGSDATAAKAAADLDARIDALEARYAGRTPVTVFIEVGSRPLYTIGDDPLLNDALRICGAVNLYADTGIPAPRVPMESVLVRKPQLIITPQQPGQHTQAVRERWTAYGLESARQGHIHIADPDALFRPGPRLIDAAEALCPAVDAARL